MRIFLAILLISSVRVLAGDLVWEPAPRADDFVDSIGVCTHWGFGSTPYGKAYAAAKQKLAESGIRHIRDSLHPHELEIYHEFGVRATIIVEPQMGSIEKQLEQWKADRVILDAIEGPNEPNGFWMRSGTTYKGQGWPVGVRMWQDEVYKAVRGEPTLSGIPVAAPTPTFDAPFFAAPITSFDYLSLHPYAGGGMPSASITWGGATLRAAIGLIGHDNDLKPLIATESGYHNCLEKDKVIAGGQSGISETAGGRYFPRHFAEYWNAGIVRTFVYEFINDRLKPGDPEGNFGLLRYDLSEKPSFVAVKNLISILGEAHWDKGAQRWIRTDSPARAVKIAIDAPPAVHHCALSRGDGAIDLLLWQEVVSFDLKKKKDLSPAAVKATVHLSVAASASEFRPLVSKEAQAHFDASQSITVDVPDEVIILRFAAPAPASADPPAATSTLTATATATSATLQWRGSVTAPASYIVYRLGRYLATVAPAPDGSATFTDSTIAPGIGYTYTVRAVGDTGLLSAPASVIARTPNQRPDLIVEEVHWDPPHPKPGDEVRFTATIANIGNASTPAVTHGLAIHIDRKMACWCDSSHEPLAPGAKRTLTTNSGPNGKGTWTCQAGTFHIEAGIDDVNRIDESNKQNNRLTVVLSTGIGPDLVVSGVETRGDLIAGQPITLVGKVRNIGNGATPKDVSISCTFIVSSGTQSESVGFGLVKQSLAPGEEVAIPIGKAWVPAAKGVYHVVAVADDVNRIAEMNKTNNRSEPVTLEVK